MIDPPPKRPRAAKPAEPVEPTKPTKPHRPAAPALDPAALTQAMRQLMEPLAALAIAQGVPFVTLDDVLKTAFVDAARAAHPNLPSHRMVSRISTSTGINRREVSRITGARIEPAVVRRSPATRVFTKWVADPSLKTRSGDTAALPRQGPAPSFEALAQSVTRDVHPRSLLDELCRLGLARIEGDVVHAVRDAFVPKDDSERMLALMGNNIGDHLRAAVANVMSDDPPHLEQAVFADELSQASLDAFRQVMRAQWKALLEATVPALQRLIDADRAAGRLQDQRVRVGLYTYNEAMPAPRDSVGPTAPIPKHSTASKRRDK